MKLHILQFSAPQKRFQRSLDNLNETLNDVNTNTADVTKYQPISAKNIQDTSHIVSMQVNGNVQIIDPQNMQNSQRPAPQQEVAKHVLTGTMPVMSGHIFEVNVLRWDVENFCFDDEPVFSYTGLSSANAICSVVHDGKVFILVAQDTR